MGGHFLWEDILGVDMSYRRSCFMGGHTLGRGSHVSREDIF